MRRYVGGTGKTPITTATNAAGTSRAELASLFNFKYQYAAPGKGKRKYIPKEKPPKLLQTWNHTFVALSNTRQEFPPDANERAQLQLAGLGEKKTTLYLGGDFRDIYDDLIITFPKLATAGGFELMRINPFGKKLEIIPSPENGYSVDYLKAVVHHSKVFVRPIQHDLALNEVKEEV